jgi:hypothetical protein
MEDDKATCGKGIANHSPNPRAMADVAAAMSNLFATHMKALDLQDANGRREHDAYNSLAGAYAAASERLASLAEEAEGYRSLPMAPHDMAFMTGREPLAAFERVVAARKALRELLQAGSDQDEAMLAQMRAMQDGA